MKRTGLLVLGVIALLMLSPGIASAKVPPFTVEASPNDPTAGESVSLTVRFWDDAEHTRPARWWPDVPELERFLWAHPVGDAVEAIPVDLRLVRSGVYRGEATLPSEGRWVLCSFTRRCGRGLDMAGYPDRIELTVVPPPAPDAEQGRVGAPPPYAQSRFALSPIVVTALVAMGALVVVRTVRSAHLRR